MIVPLYFNDAIDVQAFQSTWLAAPVPPGPPLPPAVASAQRGMKSASRVIQGGRMMAPSMIPNKIAMIKEEPLPPDSGGGVIGGVPGGIPGGQVGGVLGGILGGGASPLVSVAALPPPPVKRILRVGGNVKPPRQIYAEPVKYPAIAKAAKIQGVVVIDAVIDQQGDVATASVDLGC